MNATLGLSEWRHIQSPTKTMCGAPVGSKPNAVGAHNVCIDCIKTAHKLAFGTNMGDSDCTCSAPDCKENK